MRWIAALIAIFGFLAWDISANNLSASFETNIWKARAS
jgi:hypothetical protein